MLWLLAGININMNIIWSCQLPLQSMSGLHLFPAFFANFCANNKWLKNNKRRWSISFGMRHALYFNGMKWQLECISGLQYTMIHGGQPTDKSICILPKQVSIHWLRRSGKLGWNSCTRFQVLFWIKDLESGARNIRRLHGLRYHVFLSAIVCHIPIVAL